MTMHHETKIGKFCIRALALLVAVMLINFPSSSIAQTQDDSNKDAKPEVVLPQALATENREDLPFPSEKQVVFFTPQDENTSCTVIFLYNRTRKDVNVKIVTFTTNGSKYIDTAIPVPAKDLVRIVSDDVSTVAGSWNAPVLVNFRTSSAYGKMILPKGVSAEAYVAWNGANAFDPLAEVQTLPIRFWQK